ncbi:hypothetical protein BHU72_01695 [Desulfuribacillus stibiiarsenatis]|uniref:Uncharacterized protein n=1 Tax=Desulfuribacillus stibiiarsenatis TaxID=1390249 RepID=A0A1E5LA47_9FIRM|nr:hypothetical protein [Desulfuribacillus stibiiarsenatis]OEH86995.1 hypothetical protein BHU72_01695 [Desulfuribacillus stibiiarsenatis]
MNDTFVTKVKKFLALLLIAGVLTGISYLIVYKVSLLPNGYNIVLVKNDSISLKSFNMVGMEKNIIDVNFSEKDIWKIGAIEDEIKRQKEFFWLFFSAVTISIFLLVYKLRKRMKFWKAIFESNIIISVLFPIVHISSSVNRISNLIS